MNLEYTLLDKTNLIYEYLYNINTIEEFIINKIELGKISINDIKISIPSDIDTVDYINFYNLTKNDILSGNIKLIHFNTDINEIIFKKYSSESYPLQIKINFYNKKENISKFNTYINNDSLMSYILSELVINKLTKHILLPIINIDLKFQDLEKYIINYDNIYSNIKNLINNNEKQNICCLQIREYFFKLINLEEYLQNNSCKYKTLIFQVIHTLIVIEKKFNNFSHNNLILKNIYIYLKKPNKLYTIYDNFNNGSFYIPNDGFDIKITNFNYSTIPNFYNTSSKIHNDINTFFTDLLKIIKIKNDCDDETIKFIKIFINKKNNLIDIIKHTYFKEFTEIDKNKYSKETFFNNEYLNYNINTTLSFKNLSSLGNQEALTFNNKKILSNFLIMKNKRFINNINNINTLKGGNTNPFISNDQKKIEQQRIDEERKSYDKKPYEEKKPDDKKPYEERKSYDKKPYEEKKPDDKKPYEERKSYDKKPYEEKKSYEDKLNILSKPQNEIYNQQIQELNISPYTISTIDNELNFTYNPKPQPIQKIYNINVSNPLNHSIIYKIYEDMIPETKQNLSALTIYERLEIINFLRSSMLIKEDGEEMTDKTSILSYIKILHLNPYIINKNKYGNLAQKFLLYNAGYPIRYDNTTGNIVIGKNAMGINVRLYMLTTGDISCNNINNDITSEHFDIWREIKYYDWIKNNIIKNKISPNFISPILYKIETKSKIDWGNVEKLKQKGKTLFYNNELIKNQEKINSIPNIKTTFNALNTFIQQNKTNKIIPYKDKHENITNYCGKSLILLTEAPTINIIQWASISYNTIGSVNKMITTGYHDINVWRSILFQLVYAYSVLQKSEIYFTNLNLYDNVYIKDITFNPNNIGSWVYIINNISYYIPNYGYILLLDSKYNDVNINESLIKNNDNSNELLFKIYSSKLFKFNSNYNISNIKLDILAQFKSILHPDNFINILKINNGINIHDSIKNLLKKIYDDTEQDISKYIFKYFSIFIHNRIGTNLTKNEVELILNPSQKEIYKGDIIPKLERNNLFVWVIFIEKIPNTFQSKILVRKEISKNNFEYSEEIINNGSLRRFADIIMPDPVDNIKYDNTHIYEIYNLDKLN